jgi:hypothetical protein
MRRWKLSLLIFLIIGGGLLAAFLWDINRRASVMTKVLDEEWNPYADPPDRLAIYPYSHTATEFALYIFWKRPTPDQLADKIMLTEREWQLLPHPERDNKVARSLLEAYHDPAAWQSRSHDVKN